MQAMEGVVENDIREMGLKKGMASDRETGRKQIPGPWWNPCMPYCHSLMPKDLSAKKSGFSALYFNQRF